MTRPSLFESLPALAARVEDGMSVAIGGTLFTRMPVALLSAVCERRPRDLHYLSWGGGLPLEMLLEVEAVGRATLCFSSLDIFGQAPRFRAAVESGRLELTELTAHAFHQGLSAGRRRLSGEPLIWPAGSQLTELPGFPAPIPDPLGGERLGWAQPIRPDVLLLHAQAADTDGNIEIFGARGVDPTVIPAAHRVLVTVEEVVERGELGKRPHSIVIPRQLVTAIAVVPGGAAPTSCLPYYCADYTHLYEWATNDSVVEGVPHPPATDRLEGVSIDGVRGRLTPATTSPEPTLDEWMACWLARQYDNTSVCSVGAVSPLASASYLLAKATHAPDLTLITNGGGYIDVEERPLLFGLGEWLDATSSITHAGGDETYELYYQPGFVTHEVVSVAQIDGSGRTNNRMVRSPSGRIVRLPGQGGMGDVADMHKHFSIYLPRQSPLNTPEAVGFVTASRTLLHPAERRRAGYQPGSVTLVTNLAVFELDPDAVRFRLSEVFPWTSLEELEAATGFSLGVQTLDAVRVVEPPSTAELAALRTQVDPLGLRRLEFVASKDRHDLLRELLELDAHLMAAVLGRHDD